VGGVAPPLRVSERFGTRSSMASRPCSSITVVAVLSALACTCNSIVAGPPRSVDRCAGGAVINYARSKTISNSCSQSTKRTSSRRVSGGNT